MGGAYNKAEPSVTYPLASNQGSISLMFTGYEILEVVTFESLCV